MGSACGTPQYTNYTVGFADCLDYIFYQDDSFDVQQVSIYPQIYIYKFINLVLNFLPQVVPFPSLEELQANTALPSIVFPSDHISLAADLRWK